MDDCIIAEKLIWTSIKSNNIIIFRKSLIKSKIASSTKGELKRVKANQSVLQKFEAKSLAPVFDLDTLQYFSSTILAEFLYTLQVEKAFDKALSQTCFK